MQKTISEQFSDYLRNKLTDDEFWKWVREWFDVEIIIEITEDWDDSLKEEILTEWKTKTHAPTKH
jgi:hypothetical protein